MRLVDEAGHLGSCLGLHAGDNVCVLLKRECRRLVAQALADDLDGDAGLQGQRGMRVPVVM